MVMKYDGKLMRERKRVCVCVCVTSAGMEAQYVFSEIIHIISANSSNVTTRIAYVKHLQLNPITSAQASSCKISFYIYSRFSDKCFQIYFNNIDIYNKCQFPNGNSFFGACHATSQISRWRLTGLIRREFGQTWSRFLWNCIVMHCNVWWTESSLAPASLPPDSDVSRDDRVLLSIFQARLAMIWEAIRHETAM